MSNVIELRNVTKRFGRQAALDDVSLQVPPGVVFALLGENGAGKTTAIRLMLGLDEVTAGEVRVLGLSSRADGLAIRRRVGYVPERPTLYEWMTAAEIGWFTAGFFADASRGSVSVADFEHHFRELLAGFNVPADRRLSQLSRGMRAKVGLALALAHQPELLVLDEPTSGLDTMVRREFLESMVDIAAEGRTVLLSSHQISEVERVADIVAMVHCGRLLLVERLDELKRTTRELAVTVTDTGVPPPEVAGQTLTQQRRGRQWHVIVRGLDDAALEQMRLDDLVVAVESRTPTLEEIFVAYMQTNSTPSEKSTIASTTP